MAEQRHANSKRVTIFRKGAFLENAQKDAQDFMSMSKKSIGSYFHGSLGGSIGTGLEFEEINALMPLIIDIPKDDRIFREKVTEFFKNLSTPIPYATGKELEVGLVLDNSKALTWINDEGKLNRPINLQDYIRYRHALKHPLVAPTKAASVGNMLAEFYVFDPEASNAEQAAAGKQRDKAVSLYLGLKTDAEKVDAMLTLLGVDVRAFSGIDEQDKKHQRLYDLATSTPEMSDEFVKIHEIDHFDTRVSVQKMINTGVIRKVGAQYIDAETGAVIGHNMEEAIYWMKDINNSDKVSILKAKLQEKMKQKLPQGKGVPKRTATAK